MRPSPTILVAALLPTALLLALAHSGYAQGDPVSDTEHDAIVIRPAAPPDADRQQAMERWHREWLREMAPVKRAVEALEEAAGASGSPPSPLQCRELGWALAHLDRERIFPVPEFATHRHLDTALNHLAHAVAACLEGRWAAVPHRLGQAREALGNAALALRRFGLEP